MLDLGAVYAEKHQCDTAITSNHYSNNDLPHHLLIILARSTGGGKKKSVASWVEGRSEVRFFNFTLHESLLNAFSS
jgi:hypothetical protein